MQDKRDVKAQLCPLVADYQPPLTRVTKSLQDNLMKTPTAKQHRLFTTGFKIHFSILPVIKIIYSYLLLPQNSIRIRIGFVFA